MAFGNADPSTIADPLFEPHWPGRRALVVVEGGSAAIRDVDLGELPRTAALREALVAASAADEAVLDGYLLPGLLPGVDAPRLPPSSTAGITTGELLRHILVGSFRRGRTRPPDDRPLPVIALPADGPIAFAAVDLLWLDGEPLVGIPLGERKRLLESVVGDAELVRRSDAVRAPAERWHGQWRAHGFVEMAVRAANSRYVPGGVSEDWTIIPIPRS